MGKNELTWGLVSHPLFYRKNEIKIKYFCPGWCGSVDWAPACEPKDRWFDSQSGHRPGLQARLPVGGAWEATTHWSFSSSLSPSPLSPSFPLSLKINKIFKKKKIICFFPKPHPIAEICFKKKSVDILLAINCISHSTTSVMQSKSVHCMECFFAGLVP